MLVTGLTGGIASGKSFVAEIFSRLSAKIIDADLIVRDLLKPGMPAWKEVSEHFGKEIMAPEQSIDRKKLGNIVFNNAQERDWLNKRLHPRVFSVYRDEIKRLSSTGQASVIIFDAALLVETGYYKNVDKLVVVYCEPEQQLSRLMERDQLNYEQASARINSQMPLTEKRKYGDFIIENTGTREETERQVRAIYRQLKTEAERTA